MMSSSNSKPMHIIDDVISSSMAPESIVSNNVISTTIDRVDFSNYDVLLMSSSTEGVVRFAPGNHVGNQRFRVLLSLHRSRYLQADKIGDDDVCTKIAEEVLDLVCNKCIPNGRFFEQVDTDDGSSWKELDVNLSTIELIKQALKNEPTPTTSPLMTSSSKLRRRRRTYGSIVSEDSEGETTITKPDRFDVICESNGQHLKFGSEHTGNYRLKVLLDMRLSSSSSSWSMSNPSKKEQAAHDIVSSIIDASSSRFLRVKNNEQEGYAIMSREMAVECITNTLSQMSYGKIIKKQQQQPIVQHESEVEMLLRRKRKKDTLEQCAKRVKCDYCAVSSAAGLPTTFNSLPFGAITSHAA